MADEVVGRGIIEVVGDATQFSAAMAKVAQDAGIVERKLTDTAQAIGETFQQAEQSTTAATTKIDGTTTRYIRSLEREIAAVGLSRDSYRAWEAQLKSIPQSVYAPYIAKLNEATAAQNAAAEAAKREAQAQRDAAAARTTRDNFVQSLRSQSEAIGKTQADLLELRAAQLGVTREAAPYIAKLREAEGALKGGGKALNEYGQTAKQTAAALRQVPAQLTDIVVSLQGGQAPLTVLLQQGGQLKDVFGGVVPAAKALGSAVVGLVTPYTAAAAAVATLIFGYAKGSAETDKFKTSLILTGNAVGATVSDVTSYAVAIDKVVGTQAQASAALVEFIDTNRVARENLQQFATVAIQVQQATGKAVSDTVKEFESLGKEPVEASRRLNEQTGFLTFAVYEQIKALKEQGRETDAANLAQRTYAEALASRTAQITANLGLIERAWKSIKAATLDAGDAILNVGRQSTSASKLEQARAALANVEARVAKVRSGETFAFQGGKEQAEKDLKAAEQRVRDLEREETDARVRAGNRGLLARQNAAAIEAETAISRIRKESASNTDKLNKALTEYRLNLEKIRAANPNSALLDPERIARDEANIREQFKEPKGRTARTRAFTDDAATKRLLELQQAEASLRAQLDTSDKLTGAAKELAEFDQLIADLKEKKVLTADQKALLAAQDKIRAQLEINAGIEKEIRVRNDATKETEKQAKELERFNERAAQIRNSVGSLESQRAEQGAARLQSFGLGDRANEELTRFQAIEKEFRSFREQLTKSTPKDLLGSQDYEDQLAFLRDAQSRAIEQTREYFEQLKALQSDWLNGAKTSYANYIDAASDTAGQTERLFTTGFKAAEDALATFVRTGKINFKSFADAILIELARIYARQQIAKLSSSGDLLGLLGNLATIFSGGPGFSTNSTGTSLPTSGGRAIGGPVAPRRMYDVVENGPELLNMQGRTMLLTGEQGGMVTPLQGGRSSKAGGVKVTVVNTGTAQQVVATRQMSDDEIVVMVQDAASAARRGAVSDVRSQIRQSNGGVRRDMQSSFRLQRAT